jgi:hypothetical protein
VLRCVALSICIVLSCHASLPNSLSLYILSLQQAIDKLEAMLNGGMKSGQTNMFGPKEYVQIYT